MSTNFHIILPEWEETTTVVTMDKVLESLTIKERKKLAKDAKRQAKFINHVIEVEENQE